MQNAIILAATLIAAAILLHPRLARLPLWRAAPKRLGYAALAALGLAITLLGSSVE
jgi:hypothetical protein